LKRIIPIVLPDAKVATLDDRLDHALHWKRRRGDIEAKVLELGAINLGPAAMLEYQHMHDFARHVTEILTLVIDRLIPRDFDRMREQGFRDLLALMTTP
jgi:hypothetical protein